ncbi:MAG: hypothetical protein IKV96_02065 [Firmicutes bacterium]|nr:hypothetical protein [Bacillota bacterium]
MKKRNMIIALLLVLVMIFSFAGCGGSGSKVDTPDQQQTQVDQDTADQDADADQQDSNADQNADEKQPSGEADKPATDKKEETPKVATKADAQAYIGKSLSSLISAIGSPVSSQYAPSCMGDGEDGQLTYNGFTVYTYKEAGSEKVVDVA